VSTDELSDAVWQDHPPASAAKNLQSCVVRLRKALGPEAIVTTARGYALEVPADGVDARKFEEQVERARELLAIGEVDRVAFLLEQALALWRGPAFHELQDWPPAQREAGRLDLVRQEAEEMYVDSLIRSGRPREALARAHAMVSATPLRERRWELLALAQYQVGAQGEALRTIRQLRSVLAHELGIDPSPGMIALEQAILRQDVALLVPRARVGEAQCPWQGLKAYDLDDADRFFGRGRDVDTCLALLHTTSFVALVGPSGSGKSSILRAGVLATLRNRGHKIVLITPGRRPLQSLLALPDDAGPDTVLAVDQAEEVFSLCEDPEERRSFLERLTHEAVRRPVLVTVRGDRLTQVTEHPGFSRLVERGMHLVGTLDENGLRDAIDGPARQAGVLVEPGLVDLLVGEVRADPGALPLLSHALVGTWERREGNTLTVDGYHASGGIRGAVAQSAEQLYARIGTDQRRLLRDLVLRLVSPGPDGEAVRTRVPRRLIASDADHEQLIELLVEARLVTSDKGVLEITHEALARAWPRLRGWLDDDIEGQRTRHHLSVAADAWDTLGRPGSELYRGVRLSRALEWKAGTDSTLTETEHAFLHAASVASTVEELSAAERARAQARLIRRLRVVLVAAIVTLVIALAAGGIAVHQSQRAGDNADRAEASTVAAEARRAGAQALTTADIDESMLLAVAAVRLDDSPATRDSLQSALARNPELIASTQMSGGMVTWLDVSPDGRRVATFDEANTVRLYDISSGELLGEYQAGTQRRSSVVSMKVNFSPDGESLAVTQAAPTRQPVVLLDAATLEPMAAQPQGLDQWRWQPNSLAFSQDGQHLAVTLQRVQGVGTELRETSGWAVVWNLGRPDRPLRIRLEDGRGSVALSPDGTRLYTTAPLTIHDLVTRNRPVKVPEPVVQIALSPDGRLLAGSVEEEGLVLLDARTGKVRGRLEGNGFAPYYVVFSADGHRVASISFENSEAMVWDVDLGKLLVRLPLSESGEKVDLSADGSTAYTAGSGTSLRHWDVEGDRRFVSLIAARKPGRLESSDPAQAAPGGGFVAVPGSDRVTFFDVVAGSSKEASFRGGEYSSPLGSWHPNGVHYALATDGTVRVWDARDAKLVLEAKPSGRFVKGLDYSTDGTRLVIGEISGRVTMLDSGTLIPVGRSVELDQGVCCVAAGPDNRTAIALTGLVDPSGFLKNLITRWALVDLESGEVRAADDVGIDGDSVDFSPDGRHAAVAGRGGEVLVLDLETGGPVRPPVIVSNTELHDVTFSPDGQRIVATGAAPSVTVLDGRTGLPLARVVTPRAYLGGAGFGRDPGTILIAAAGNGPVYEWNTDIDRAVDFACRVAGRGFTEAEWAAHFGSRPYQETCPGG
jgi:DNA-binding SARP family transcriptional activator/WD40 repeat protein